MNAFTTRKGIVLYNLLPFVFFLLITIISGNLYAQTTGDYRSATTNGNWGTLGSWQRYNGSAWVTPTAGEGTPTSASGVITIRSTHTISVTSSVSVDQVIIDNGGTVQLGTSAGVTLTIADGTGIDLINNGTLIIDGKNNGKNGFLTINGQLQHNNTAASSFQILPDGNVNFGGTGKISFTGESYVQGTGDFLLTAGATIEIGSANGIITSSTTSGNLRTSGVRTLNGSANYVYNGSSAQATGTNLPATIASGGSLTISNTSGTVTLSQATTIASGATATINTGAALATGVAITRTGTFNVNGIFQLNSGGSVSAAPTYGSSSTLVYNQTGTPTLGSEWTGSGTTVGSGVPQAVTVQNNTTLAISASRGIAGTLSVSNGSSVVLGTTLSIGTSASVSGTLQLNSGGTISVTPTYANTSSLVYNQTGSLNTGNEWTGSSTTVGSGVPQTVTIQNNTTLSTSASRGIAGTLSVSNGSSVVLGAALSIGTSASVGGTLQLNSGGTIGVTPTYTNTSSLVYNQTGSLNTGNEWTGSSTTVGSGVPQAVIVQNNTTITTSANRGIAGTLSVADGSTLAIGGALNTGGTATVSGILQLNSGGSVGTAPVYGSSSSLIYNQTGTPTFGSEWTGNNTTAGSGVPQNVTIQNSTTVNMPSSDRGLAGNLTLTSGTLILNSSSGNLFVGGNWTRSSGTTFTPNKRKVTFNGSNNSTIIAPNSSTRDYYGAFGGERFYDLGINKSSKSVTAGTGNGSSANNISIRHTLTLTAGTLSIGDSSIVLISKNDTTADIAAINSSNAAINYNGNGRFIVQRFISNPTTVRTWRYLTAPLQANDPLTISQGWQEGVSNGNPWPGYGTLITGTGGPSNGFDASTTGKYSIQYFDNTVNPNTWGFPANTNVTLMSKPAWAIFIRGDRSAAVTGPYTPANNLVLEPKGKINVGDTTYTISSGKFNLIGNPYPSRIDMSTVTNAAGSPHPTFRLWDPKAYVNYSQTGAYVLFKYLAGSYQQTNNAGTTWTTPGTVESGEAIMIDTLVKSTAINFHETDKLSGTSTLNGLQSRPAGTAMELSGFYAKLGFYDASTSQYKYIDGVSSLYNAAFSSAVITDEDYLAQTTNFGTLRIAKAGYQLYMDAEPLVQADDTIYFNTKLNQGKHRLAFYSKNLDPALQPFAIDNYTGSTVPILVNDSDSTFLDFTVTSDPLSNNLNRFMVVFKPVNTTPVKFISVKAIKRTSDISLEWETENEINVKQYEVERSTNGRTFTKVSSLKAMDNTGNQASYKWLDVDPAVGEILYRIRMVDMSGESQYSHTIKVINENPSKILLNNPVHNGVVELKFNNEQKGNYNVRILNSQGQTIKAQVVKYNGGNSSEYISISQSLSKGIFQLEIQKPSGDTEVKKIFVE